MTNLWTPGDEDKIGFTADEWNEEIERNCRWGFKYTWQGWHRCLWVAFQIDLKYKTLLIVLFGHTLHWGRHYESPTTVTTTKHYDQSPFRDE